MFKFLNTVADIILGMGDISMDESEQIPVILGDLITGMHDTLLSAVTSSGDDTTSAEQAGDIEQRCRELLVRFNPSLEKLKVSVSFVVIILPEISVLCILINQPFS